MKKNLSRVLSIFLVAILLSASTCADEDTMEDVQPPEHWANAYMCDEEMATYVPASIRIDQQSMWKLLRTRAIQPDAPLTGEEFVEMTVRALLPRYLTTTQGETTAEWVMAAAQAAGLLEGTSLSASEAISRYDAAVVVTNALASYQIAGEGLERAQGLIGDFSIIPEEYRQAVVNIYALGLVAGKDGAGRYCGEDKLTFAEGCVLVRRMLDQVGSHLRIRDIRYSLWQETPEGLQFFSGAVSIGLPFPAEEAVVTYPELIHSSFFYRGGYWRRLTWPGLEVDCFHCNGMDVVYGIRVTMPGLSTFRGISVGSTLDELRSAYYIDEHQITPYRSEGERETYLLWPEPYSKPPEFDIVVEHGVVTSITLGEFNFWRETDDGKTHSERYNEPPADDLLPNPPGNKDA